MKTYYKFILTVFSKSFIYVFFIMFSLVFILNILSELEFFRNIDVGLYLPIYISILNSQSVAGYQSFVWNDKIVLEGDDDLDVYNEHSDGDWYVTYIDQDWS